MSDPLRDRIERIFAKQIELIAIEAEKRALSQLEIQAFEGLVRAYCTFTSKAKAETDDSEHKGASVEQLLASIRGTPAKE